MRDQTTIYSPHVARHYAQHRRIHPGVFEMLICLGKIDQHSAVLEVGCGTGNYIIALNDATQCTSWGIDPSEGMLDQAKHRSNQVYFQRGYAEQIDFPSHQFDLLFTVDVIHHIRNRTRFFQAAFQALKPKGQLCIVTDSENDIHRRRPLSSHFPATVAIELERYPRLTTLKAEMAQTGFSAFKATAVEVAYALTDIKPYDDKAFSALHLISDEAYQTGLKQMSIDLAAGPIDALSLYTMLWGRK